MEIIINSLMRDPSLLENGSAGILLLIFIYRIHTGFRAKIERVIADKNKLIKSELENIVHNKLDEVRVDMKKEHEHLMKNIHQIKNNTINSLHDKHNEIEKIGNDYINLIKEKCKDQ
ncbi:MAG: hypothetical protein HWN81_15000 [Candidatus Lokiarchaeota archaeon]|nr:hypothetical protein [Candidatus Lokiarchaeota archaeon]